MTSEKLFKALEGSYHDGALLNAIYTSNTLYLYCHRNSPDPEGKEDPNYRYVIIRFDDVIDLKVYDWKKSEEFISYSEHSFCKPEGCWAISGIDFLAYKDRWVEFGECLRFHANDVELLAHSGEELDFSKYRDG